MNYSANGVLAIGASGSDARKQANLEAFKAIYTEELRFAVQHWPEAYAYPESEVGNVVERMMQACERRAYSKDGGAIKATCRRLGLKHTYKAINAFLNGEE